MHHVLRAGGTLTPQPRTIALDVAPSSCGQRGTHQNFEIGWTNVLDFTLAFEVSCKTRGQVRLYLGTCEIR